LDDRSIELFGARFRDHSPHPTSRHYTYLPPLSLVPPQAAAGIGGRSWDLQARVERDAGAGGVVMAMGNENAGLSFFVQDDRLIFDYNIFGEHHVLESNRSVPAGESTIGVKFRRDQNDAEVTLTLNGDDVGTKHLPLIMRIISTSGMGIGRDFASPVSTYYDDEFPFEGRIERVDIQLITESRSDEKETAAREGMARQ
jgi:arylsulfatase